jgi:polyphenol oxidase
MSTVRSSLSLISFRVSQRPESWDRLALANGQVASANVVTWLNQTHGSSCVNVEFAGHHRGEEADAAVTSVRDVELVIRTADCVPVLLVGESKSGEPVLGLAHAGWQGLLAGVIETTTASMRVQGAVSITAWVGPCIGSECYEFTGTEREKIAERYGASVRALTSWGTPALDMVAGVRQALVAAEVTWAGLLPDWSCTSCDPQRYSHRARQDAGRMALAAKIL